MVSWEQLERACAVCGRCGLGRTRTHVVIGDGARESRVMLVGEGPGEQEDLQGRAFVGPAGQLLDRMLACIGLDRGQVYIANIVKCRPPHNRDPLPEEQAACLPYLRAQVRLIRPQIIVCLGRIAAQAIIRPDFRITRERGQWVERKGYWLTATYHPSALLRDPSKKRAAYEDLKSLRAKIGELGLEVPPGARNC